MRTDETAVDKLALGTKDGPFRLLWTAQAIGQFSNQFVLLAIPLLAIITLDVSAFSMGVITAAGFLPYLVVGLFAGVHVDRMSRKAVMLASEATKMLALTALPVLLVAGLLNVSLLVCIAFIIGTCAVYFDVAHQAYVPQLLAREHLQAGNARLETTSSAARVVGPGVGGILVQAIAPIAAVVAGIFGVLATMLALARTPALSEARRTTDTSITMRQQIVEGLRFVLRHSILGPLLTSYASMTLFVGVFQGVVFVFMARVLGLEGGQIGVVIAIGSSGFVLGAVVSRQLARRIGIGRALVSGLILLAGGYLVIGAAPTSAGVAVMLVLAAGSFLSSMGIPIYNVNTVSLRQAVTPNRLLGRVASVSRVAGRGTVALGALLGGALASFTDARLAVLIAGVGGLLSLAPAYWSALMGIRSISELEEPS